MATSTRADEERRARLIAKYRAELARRGARRDPNEVIDQFAEEVFGSDEGVQVLIEYLREHGDPSLFDGEGVAIGHDAPSPDGR